jgi:hypothetical protein
MKVIKKNFEPTDENPLELDCPYFNKRLWFTLPVLFVIGGLLWWGIVDLSMFIYHKILVNLF